MKTINTVFEKDIDLSIFEPYKINCKKCCGLCCVALYCAKSDGFPRDKEAGAACEKLKDDYTCKIHSELSKQGLKGCLAYDCFGAGQSITRHLKAFPNWSALSPKEGDKIFSSYLIVLRVQQTLWYLSHCLILRLPKPLKKEAESFIHEGRDLIENPFEIPGTDTQLFYKKSNDYLKHICTVFQTYDSKAGNLQAKNYMGNNMQKKNLAKTDFSMSLLIAANLAQANLYAANFLGADMRDTNICSTDLSQSLFLTQAQINTAKGNKDTILPPYLHKPQVWDCN